MRLTHTIRAKKQLGITLLESLIAIVVVALGILAFWASRCAH